jgi:hypothetical protein
MKHTMKICFMLFALIAVLVLVAGPAASQQKPNIILIVSDH